MALKKLIELPSTVGVEYWQIDGVLYRRAEKILEVIAFGYVDKAAADSGAEPVTQRAIKVPAEDADIALAALHDAAGGLVYSFLREAQEFSDAINV